MKTTSKLTLNDSTLVESFNDVVQRVTINVTPKGCRYETLEDIEYIVVPMVILTVGVHNGSNGPILYTEDELAKIPEIWNHKPVVVYHPERNGQGISACDPIVLESRKVGMMLNTTFKDGKLKSEAWIRKDRADKIDNRIMEAINNGEMMELSTGLYADHEEVAGEWNGEEYTSIARNFRPDHLALLPDMIGACSIKDGAGLLRNAQKANVSKKGLDAIVQNFLMKLGLTENEMSHQDINYELHRLIKEKLNVNEMEGPYCWVEAVYDNFVIYEYDGKRFRLGYSVSDSLGVTLSDDPPVEVRLVSEYRTVEGALVGNQSQNQEPNESVNQMKKKEVIDAILANAVWKDTKREALDAMSLDQLKTIHNGIKPKGDGDSAPPTPAEPAAAKPAGDYTAPKADPAPTGNATPQAPKTRSLKDFLQNEVPEEFREVLTNGVVEIQEKRNRLVESILNSENCPFTKEELLKEPVSRLKKLASFRNTAKPAEPQSDDLLEADFSGQGETITGNRGSEEEPLEMPTMNFAKA